MIRQDYIAGLEEIRKQVKKIGAAFAAVDLTDKTGMESDRRKKTTKLVADLCDRLYEDIAISAKVAADNAEAGIGEQGDLFDDAAKTAKAKAQAEKPAAEEAEVVDVPTIEYKPEAKKAGAKEDFASRKAVSKEARKLRNRISFLVTEIGKDEARMKTIETVLAAPGPSDDIMELTREYLELKRDLDAKTDEWATLMENE